jgi:hypothetical protein
MTRESTYIGEDITIGGGEGPDKGSPFVFFKLYETDVGHIAGRTVQKNFQIRTPSCVDMSLTEVVLLISNSGLVISDLVVLEYQFVYCVDAKHGPTDGFTISHAGEAIRKPFEDYFSLDVVPAGGSVTKHIPVPTWTGKLANLYFRVRASTIWSPKVPMDKWDFANEPSVTEAHLRIPG